MCIALLCLYSFLCQFPYSIFVFTKPLRKKERGIFYRAYVYVFLSCYFLSKNNVLTRENISKNASPPLALDVKGCSLC